MQARLTQAPRLGSRGRDHDAELGDKKIMTRVQGGTAGPWQPVAATAVGGAAAC